MAPQLTNPTNQFAVIHKIHGLHVRCEQMKLQPPTDHISALSCCFSPRQIFFPVSSSRVGGRPLPPPPHFLLTTTCGGGGGGLLHYHLQENYFSNEESRPINPGGLTFLRLPSLGVQLVKIPFKKFIAQFCSNPSQQAQLWNFHLN